MNNRDYKWYKTEKDEKAGIYTCWCPCGCGCRSSDFKMGENGLCYCCDNNISHEIAPSSIGPGRKLLLRQHEFIGKWIRGLTYLCETCEGAGTIWPLEEKNVIDCPRCGNPKMICPKCNKEKNMADFPVLKDDCWDCCTK